MAETILLYGADMPLGRRLIFYLESFAAEANQPVTVVAGTNPGDMEQVQKETWEQYTAQRGTARPTLVVNAHVVSDLQALETDPEWAFTMNTIPAVNIALAARGAGIPMVQISTDHVFRGSNGPYATEDQPHPVNMFGVSMYYAEQSVAALYPVEWRGDQLPRGAAILRTSYLYGAEVETGPQVALAFPEQVAVVEHDLKFSPTFLGEAAFLISRNLIQSPQTFARQFIHMAAHTAPISWHDLLAPTGAKLEGVEYDPITTGVRVGKSLGLIPTKGWALSSDYQKGVKEYMLEAQQQSWVRYW